METDLQTLLSSPPLVGREEVLKDLLTHLRASPGPEDPPLLALHGPAGVGKTRLTRVVEREAERQGWKTLRGRAYSVESDIPYASLADAFVPLFREMDSQRITVLSRGGESELRYLFPGIGAPEHAPLPPASDEPEEFRTRLFWTFSGFLRKLAGRDPVLVVLEDLQWADPSSLELLHFLGRNVGEHPVRFLCTYADDYVEADTRLERFLASLLSSGDLRRLRLGPLQATETRDLVASIFDVPEESIQAFSERVHEWTRGNPFFVVETLRSLVESGRLHRHEDTWLGWEVDDLGVSATIRDVLMRRFGRCSSAARDAGEWTAAAGDRISHSLLAVWEELLARPSFEEGHPAAAASVRRRMGLTLFWSGRHDEALEEFDAALERAAEPEARGRIRLAPSVCLQEVGRWEEARTDVEEALARADADDLVALRAAAHRALALLHTWRGPPDAVRHHGARAVELAARSGDRNVEFWGRWALAVLEGMTGHLERMDTQVEEARRIADELRSPVFRLWTDELRLERAYVTGRWEEGLTLGERAVAVARSLEQETLLPRLLVSTALIHLGRDDLERGKVLVDEAWELAVGRRGSRSGADVHTLVPAHIGRVAYHVASEEYDEALRIGEEGLALAEESGYVIWAIHRLLPLMAEAHLLKRDLEGARRIGRRIRTESERMDHALGRAWADACDALVTWLSGDVERGAELLGEAAERLEAIPVVPDAARMRRQLAGRLAELGERDTALDELRRVHEIFLRLGADRELEKTRGQFRELDARPPRPATGPGKGELTGREVEVAGLVAERNSNKAIAKELGISHRTVSTHLSNTYRKLEISSRNELADLVREDRI